MKKFVGCLALALGCVMCSSIAVMADDVTVKIGDTQIDFDQPPIVVDGRTLVPLRAIFEALDTKVEWDEENKEVTGTRGETVIKMKIDEPYMQVNGETIELDVPAQIVNSRTLVPVRAISKGLGETVNYNPKTNIIKIKTSLLEQFDINNITVNPNWLKESGIKITQYGKTNYMYSQLFQINEETSEEEYGNWAWEAIKVTNVIRGDEARAIAMEQGVLDTDKLETKVTNTFGDAEWVAIEAEVYKLNDIDENGKPAGDVGGKYTYSQFWGDADIDLRTDNTDVETLSGDSYIQIYDMLYDGKYYNLAFSSETEYRKITDVFCLPKGYDNLMIAYTGCVEGEDKGSDFTDIYAEHGGGVWLPLKEN